MNHTYKNLVFTKHALERLSGRVLTQDTIWQTISAPEKSYPGKKNTKFIRTINDRLVHVVAAPIANQQWLIVSAWVRGEEDRASLMWQLITLPFKFLWWILQKLFHSLQKTREKN